METLSDRLQQVPQRVHLVGIGGIGLSAIARVLAMRGHAVSGSDLRTSPLTEELRALGITIYQGHAAAHIADAEMVVVSSAVPEDNPEIDAARAAGVPVVKRQAFIGHLLANHRTVAVAGTHGKTTTSAMIAAIMDAAGLDPSFIIGGLVPGWGTNACAGAGQWFVIEADEYDRMFHGLSPDVAVVTNIEMDHPDYYRDIDDLRGAFDVFVRGIAPGGRLIACADSPELWRVLEALQGPDGPEILTFGRSSRAHYQVTEFGVNDQGGIDATIQEGGRRLARLCLRVPGEHNALNAAAAWLAARCCGVDSGVALKALAAFGGVRRRFEVKGEAGGVLVVDDYAHHPTEIRATLAAARSRYGPRRLWAVFEPHTGSRTAALFDEFCTAFSQADRVLVGDIFIARQERLALGGRSEAPPTAQGLVAAMDHHSARYGGSADAIVDTLLAELCPGDVLLTMGAGNGYRIGERVLEELMRRDGDVGSA
jgi:UDP-N-acetylmuramate--alanine ligase